MVLKKNFISSKDQNYKTFLETVVCDLLSHCFGLALQKYEVLMTIWAFIGYQSLSLVQTMFNSHVLVDQIWQRVHSAFGPTPGLTKL